MSMDYNCYYFPEEIIVDILRRLPVKSLIKFRAVCKSWNSLIKSCTFIDTHLQFNHQNQSDNRQQLLVLVKMGKFHYCSLYYGDIPNPNPQYTHTHLIHPPLLNEERMLFSKIVGTCNGIICLADNYCNIEPRIDTPTIICNPSVRKYVILPRPNITTLPKIYPRPEYEVQEHLFGYDSRSNDYKVLRIVFRIGHTPFAAEIYVYSLAKGYWKSLNATTAVFPAYINFGFPAVKHVVFVNGALHWVQPRDRNLEEYAILFFDMTTELFGEIRMPEALRERGYHCFSLRYGESLALIDIDIIFFPKTKYCLQVWVMKEYGIVESWTKVHSVWLEGCSPKPLYFTGCDELVLAYVLDGRSTIITVDIKTAKVGTTCGSVPAAPFHPLVESLVLLNQPNAISY